MPVTLHVRGVGAARGDRQLFNDLTMTIAPGDVWGLVGANGSGKTTLLSALAGTSSTAELSGGIVLAPPDATIGYLTQEHERVPGENVLEMLRRRTGVGDAAAQMATSAEAVAAAPDDAAAADAYGAALERWLALGGADVDERAEAVVDQVGLGVGLQSATTTLSGGQAARAGLATLLLSRFDVLLLDEPTNDLDLDGLELLESFIIDSRAPMMIVSHDRELLSRCATGVVELDIAQRQVAVYGGGYDAYLAERQRARDHAREAYEEYAERLGELRTRAQTQRQWTEKGVRNARSKAPDRDKHIKFRAVSRSEKQAAKVSQSQRAIERLEEVPEPRKEWDLRLSIAAARRSGSVVATLDDAVVQLGAFTLGPVSVQLDLGDRVVLTGPNGSGKSTLLALLLGRHDPDAGRASVGAGVQVGEVDQARGLFAGSAPLVVALGRLLPQWPASEVRTLLAKFALGGEHALRPADTLSPGERTRAALALLQARGVNLLVLDEPTNHLDLPAIEQLEQAIDSYAGTLLLVTHDRRMLDSVRATRRWEMSAGRLRER